jgi:hypothetical protein
MPPKIVVPLNEEPNHEARLLFCVHLDEEWPALKESLIEKVWPAYRACWRQSATDIGASWPARGHVRIKFPDDDCAFVAPQAVWSWSRLQHSRSCTDLRYAVSRWGSTAGRGLHYDWLLESALVSLGQYSPSQNKPKHPARLIVGATRRAPFMWRYGHQVHSRGWGLNFEPKFVGTIAHPEQEPARWLPRDEWYFGTWEQFKRRMQNQFDRELSRYRKNVVTHWGLNKGLHVNYARWTIARLSGLTWREVVARYCELQRYSDGETQAKKRVREFAAEIEISP